MTSHDQLAKDLFKTFFTGFLRLVAPASAARLRLDEASFLDKEAFTDWPQGDRREMDLLARLPVDGDADGKVLVHIEIEAEARAGMDERLWKYYMQLRLRHGLPVVPILVNLTGGRPGLHHEVLEEGFEEPGAALFRYRALSLSGCRAQEYLALAEPLVWALAALMRPGPWSRAEHKMECLRRIAAADLPAKNRWLPGNWVETYLQLNERETAEYERLRELAANREVKVMEMTWAERMEAEYTRKGIEQGVERLREVVLSLLNRRFGSVPDTVRQKVEAIDTMEPLAHLAERVLDLKSVEDVEAS